MKLLTLLSINKMNEQRGMRLNILKKKYFTYKIRVFSPLKFIFLLQNMLYVKNAY